MRPDIRKRESGSILIVALLICAMGAIGVTAWVSVLNARNGQVEGIEAAMLRRVMAENGRAAAQEYFYRNVATKSSGAAYSETLPGNWGAFSIAAWGGGAPMAATSVSPNNQFGPTAYGSFTKDYTVTINDGVADRSSLFRVRSRSPMLAGDLLTLHTPTLTPAATNTITGPINVLGRAMIWTGEPTGNVDDLDAERFVNPDGAGTTLLLDDPGGGISYPDNYPLTPTTNNEFGAPDFYGRLNVVDAGVGNEENSMLAKMTSPMIVEGSATLAWTNGVACDGAGFVEIDLDDPNLPNLEIRDVDRIFFYGQTTGPEEAAAAALSPVTIVSVRSSGLQRELLTLRMFDRNFRRLNIGMKKLAGTANLLCSFENAGADPIWRMLFNVENTNVVFRNVQEGVVTVVGGIATDRSLSLINGLDPFPGSINLENDADPGTLETIAARTAWVETYWQ